MADAPALTSESVADAATYLEAWWPARRAQTRTPGVQAALWFENDLLLSLADGVADLATGEPLTTEHLFRVASHSKTFTGAALHRLHEQGRVRLDDTVGQWIGWLAESGSPLADRTVAEVLSHGAGITRDGREADHWQLHQPFLDADGLRRVVADGAEVTPANVRFKYSNIGYSLLGEVIEAVTGTSWRDHVRTELIEPLGLTSTFPDLGDLDPSRFAGAHSFQALGATRVAIDQVDSGAMSSATGVVSNASDLCRWAAAQFMGDERLLSDGSKRRMQNRVWTVEGEGEGDYGLGTGILDVGGRRLCGHGGGWPGHITRTFFDPEARLAVAVATNAIDGPAAEIAAGSVRIVDLAARNAARTQRDGDGVGPDRPDAAQRLCGRYASLWGVHDVALLGDRLVGLSPTLPEPTTAAVQYTMVDDTTLRIDSGPGHGSVGEELRFELDEGGVVRRVGGAGPTLVPLDDLGLPDRVVLGSVW
jgi:CubicO group peptidase (beta-lactamase class C family)